MTLIFYNTAAKEFALRLHGKKGKILLKRFTDGEIYVKINENVSKKNVLVVANLIPPADNIFELFLLLDSLKRAKARINLLVTYFSYGRQDRIKKGEALSYSIICNLLRQFRLQKIFVIHPHSSKMKKFLRYKEIIPLDILYDLTKKADVLVAPDYGIVDLVRKIGKKLKKPIIIIEKKRVSEKKVAIKSIKGDIDLTGKKVLLIDDMISTGSTLIEAIRFLHKHNAKNIVAYATHGIFSEDAIKRLNMSIIDNIYVSNSFPVKNKGKIKVIDISKLVEKEMR